METVHLPDQALFDIAADGLHGYPLPLDGLDGLGVPTSPESVRSHIDSGHQLYRQLIAGTPKARFEELMNSGRQIEAAKFMLAIYNNYGLVL